MREVTMAPNRRAAEESDASMRQRLVESLSQSFPGSALSKALHAMDEDVEIKIEDPLSSSCFAELRLEKGALDEEDEELTSLSWLQDKDLLKNINAGEETLNGSPTDDIQKENGEMKLDSLNHTSQSHPPHVPYNPQKHVNTKPPYSFSCLIFMAIEDSPIKKLAVKDIYSWILTHFPYFQNAPTGWKNSVRHNLSLNKCFKKVEKEKGQSIGKGSLWCIDPDYRPNLLQALRKTPYHPYHQLQMLANPQPSANHIVLPGGPRPLPLTPRVNYNMPSPHLFPFLSRRLAQSKLEDTVSDIDVANTLVSLKHHRTVDYRHRPFHMRNGARDRSPSPPEFGSERDKQRLALKRKLMTSTSPSIKRKMMRPSSPIICTSNPSEDHTYSITNLMRDHTQPPGSPGSSIDEEYDFGPEEDIPSDCESFDESDFEDSDEEQEYSVRVRQHSALPTPVKRRIMAADEDEEKKIVEGADALLNLAGIKTSHIVPLRSISPTTSNNNNNNNNATKPGAVKDEPDLSVKQENIPDLKIKQEDIQAVKQEVPVPQAVQPVKS